MPRPSPRPSLQPPRPIQNNPLLPSAGAVARGEGALATPAAQRRERGFVVSVDANSHVYRVKLNTGPILDGVPRIRAYPGDLGLLQIGQPVRVDWGLGSPYIDGILPLETARPSNDQPEGITDATGHGGQDPVLNRNMGRTARAAGEPNDILPGDQAFLGPDGAAVGALQGRVALLRGSNLAKIVAHGADDKVDIFAGLLRVLTWMGESNYVNDEGKTSFTWQGGADQLTQSGPDEEKYTVRLAVGHLGNMLRLEITTPDGQPLFRFHVDPNGRCELYSRGGLNQQSGSSDGQLHPVRFHGTRSVEIEGTDLQRVSGEAESTYEAGVSTTVSLDDTKTVGQDYTRTINRNLNIQVGGVANYLVHGPAKTTVTSGDFSVEVQGANDYHVQQVGSGNIIHEPVGGKFQVRTSNPDSVELTSNPSSHAVKFEELQQALDALKLDYNQFKQTVQTHTHLLVGSAGPFPLAGTAILSTQLVPVAPFSGVWDAAKSLIVQYS
jgi:hypothetical protein